MTGTSSSRIKFSDLLEAWIRVGNRGSAPEDVDAHVPSVHSSDSQLYIQDYSPKFKVAVPWLIDVENRIRNSTFSDEDNTESEGEWLTPAAAHTALQFIWNSSDLLPGEPQLHGTSEGHLVAEFQSELLRMTAVTSADGTILFGYRRDRDEMPRQVEIRAGSNRSRDDLHSFNQLLGIDLHGEALEAGSDCAP